MALPAGELISKYVNWQKELGAWSPCFMRSGQLTSGGGQKGRRGVCTEGCPQVLKDGVTSKTSVTWGNDSGSDSGDLDLGSAYSQRLSFQGRVGWAGPSDWWVGQETMESGVHPLVVSTAWVGLAGAQLLNPGPLLSQFDAYTE